MDEATTPTITLSYSDNNDYFSLQDSNTPSTTVTPATVNQLKIDTTTTATTNSEPFLLSPNSILKPTPSVRVSNYIVYGERRPSLVKFIDDTRSIEDIFYDAQSNISSPVTSKSHNSSKKRRPSYISNGGSSVKTTTISIHYNNNNNNNQPELKQGIVLSCTFKKKTNRYKWQEFYAVISSHNTLQLYPVCYCNDNQRNLIHVVLHQHRSYYKKPKYELKLDQSVQLSLVSPIDFVWCLETEWAVFYFQTRSVGTSRSWYQAIYSVLPSGISKKPVPRSVDVHIPQLELSIRLPLTELLKGDELVDLKRVRDGVLVLLQRHQDLHWSKRSANLCWRYRDTADWWADDTTQLANLIEPRLIEQMHELELWFDHETNKDSKWEKQTPMLMGYLISVNQQQPQKPRVYYSRIVDHYLFLYDTPQAKLDIVVKGLRRRHKPQKKVGDLLQVIDLSQVKEINKHEIIVDDTTRFETLFDLNYFPTIYQHIQEYTDHRNIKQVGMMFVKSKSHWFEKRLCILTEPGNFYALIPNNGQLSYAVDFRLSLVNTPNLYVLSGETLCTRLQGLPSEHLPSMIFENGMITQVTKPTECCFILYHHHHQTTPVIFLTRTKEEKETWLQSICSFL